jgi:spectinomycin phosphotransferase
VRKSATFHQRWRLRVLEPPADLSDATLAAAISAAYGPISSLTFLPLGHDANAWVYAARRDVGRELFVKVRLAITNEAALVVPHHLAALGIDGVIAPLATIGGGLWTSAARYAVIAYPFLRGATAMDTGMSEEQWRSYGRLLRAIHGAPVGKDLARLLRHDSFSPDGARSVRNLDEFLQAARQVDQPRASVAQFWRDNRGLIEHILSTAEQLGSELARTAPSLVLCHADIHTNNVLVAEDGRIWFVDWDETMLAPRERDLMFVIGGIHHSFVDDRQTRLFLDGYGPVDVDPDALAFYRYSWAISDIASYGEQVFLRRELGSKNLAEAVSRFHSLFEPGSIVDIALGSRSRG